MRIALGIEYNGAAYCGWQYQEHSPSVQARVEEALAHVANHDVRVICAGRTDTGVHAYGQVVHFDTESQRSEHSWAFGANTKLPGDISILWAKHVDEDFHARFSATSRVYRYVLLNRRIRPGLLRDRVSWDYRPLELNRMRQGAAHLIGEHDFSSYRAVACQASSPIRTLKRLEVHQQDELFSFELEANGFLHHMVRNIVGVLMSIGAGEAEPDWAKQVLDQRDRTQGGLTAPADGLYFVGVNYPDHFEIPYLLPLAAVW
ncbi:MAG: tRNA pseudouridine(38-40) synthase TruA [Thioalkalispiraceae bacterium]|jgi:tRNA pseudouridine38-40 synthase